MSNALEERLANLKRLLKAEQADPKGSKVYIEDLKLAIEQCERTQPYKVIK